MRNFPPKGFRPATPSDIKWGAVLHQRVGKKHELKLREFRHEKIKEKDLAPKAGTNTQWEDQVNARQVNDKIHADLKKMAEMKMFIFVKESE